MDGRVTSKIPADFLVFGKNELVQGTFSVGFIVDKKSVIKDVVITDKLKSNYTPKEKNLLEIIENSNLNWRSGKCNGENVNVRLIFKLRL